ncbi:hypothetical protein NFI96_032805, partial [Prochilodus magdalenae]
MAFPRPNSLLVLVVFCLPVVPAGPPKQGSLMIEHLTSDPEQEVDENSVYFSESGVLEHLSDQVLAGGSGGVQKYSVLCGEDDMEVFLPLGSLSEVKVFDLSGIYAVLDAPDSCGYSLSRRNGKNVLHVSYSGCHVTVEDGSYTLRVLYRNRAGEFEIATSSCDANSSHTSTHRRPLSYRDAPLPPTEFTTLSPTDWVPLPPTPAAVLPPTRAPLRLNFKRGGCSIPNSQRLLCGRRGASAAQCQEKGCCVDTVTSACYYPMDECSGDGQFVFAIPSDVASAPLNPAALIAVGRSSCKPVIANKDFAVFKFAVTECGTRSYHIGGTTIFLAEVRSPIKTLNLKYGIITRDHPIRRKLFYWERSSLDWWVFQLFRGVVTVGPKGIMIECRYSRVRPARPPHPAQPAPAAPPGLGAPPASPSPLSLPTQGWASTGYMVMSASLPALVRAKGLYGVQLRIAEDKTFTKFLPEYHQPLRVLLGKPVYLEVRLNTPNPKATLVVHYCVAYPRSARSALVLLYEGCPNPLDSDNISILYMSDLPQNRHQRRFEVKAFQFMDQSTNKYLNEEIYFMCSTEVCLPSQTPCKETCFDT